MQQSRCRWTAIHFILVLLMGTVWGLSLEAQVVPQPKAGDPLNTLNASQLERFLLGKTQFLRSFSEPEGLGPGFNQDSCASCHAVPIGGTSPITVTRFGTADKGAPFDPMVLREALYSRPTPFRQNASKWFQRPPPSSPTESHHLFSEQDS